jgi:hypothetical protein
MTLNAFFQISVSVFCIVATIYMIVLFVWSIMLQNQLGKLTKQLGEVLETAKTTSNDAKEFVEKTIKSLESFKNSIFTFDFVRRIVTEIIQLIKNNSKGSKNGQAK